MGVFSISMVCSNFGRRNIYLKQKKAGGMKITFQSPPKNLDEKMLYNILRDYKMLNCEVLVRDENGLFWQREICNSTNLSQPRWTTS